MSITNKGLFIVLEGIDGAGKTTIAKMLIKYLEDKGYKTLYTYEPTDSYYIEVLKTKYNEIRDAYIDALTYAVDRLIHVKNVIKPYLDKNYIVVCDRYFYSSIAYQTVQGAPFEWILEINRFALKPDIALYLDVDPYIGLKRKAGYKSRFPEYESIDFLMKVRNIYLKMVEKKMLIPINASRRLDIVFNDVVNIIDKYLARC